MAARRRRRSWRSSYGRRRARQVWVNFVGQNVSGPTSGTVADEVLLSETEYGDSTAIAREKCRVSRILFEFGLYKLVPLDGTFNAELYDMWLSVTTPDQHAADITAALQYTQVPNSGSRVIRAASKLLKTAALSTAVGWTPPAPSLTWKVNLKTNIWLTEPQALYFNLKNTSVEGTPDATEYWYRSRLLVERG